jgi:uncharacterized peroxidase-related enzyme
MPYIPVQEHLPGITGLLEFRQDTARPIRELTQFLLRGTNTLSEAERELIATAVSAGNECTFCTTAHKAAADKLLGEAETTTGVIKDISTTKLSPKMKALLTIAVMTGQSGRNVTADAIDKAKQEGATDIEIHDTVLIAALFCLYNRYVDGLGTALPKDASYYDMLADRLVNVGYVRPPQGFPAPVNKTNS